MAEYYFLAGEQVRGPFGLSDCFLLMDQGTLQAESMICQAGTEDWRSLGTYPELFDRLGRAKSISPPLPANPGRGSIPLNAQQRRDILAEEELREQVRAKKGSAGRWMGRVGAIMLIVGLIGALDYASTPGMGSADAPGWTYGLMAFGFFIFLLSRFSHFQR